MRAHPCGGPAHAPYRQLLPETQQPGKDHECKADDTVDDPDRGSSACPSDGEMVVWDIHQHRDRNNDGAAPKPGTVCLIDAHVLNAGPSFPEPCCTVRVEISCRSAFDQRIRADSHDELRHVDMRTRSSAQDGRSTDCMRSPCEPSACGHVRHPGQGTHAD